MNVGVQIHFQVPAFNSLGFMPKVEFVYRIVILFLVILFIVILFIVILF